MFTLAFSIYIQLYISINTISYICTYFPEFTEFKKVKKNANYKSDSRKPLTVRYISSSVVLKLQKKVF
jgi:hypothetical protein